MLPEWTKHLWDINQIKRPVHKYYEIDISNICNLNCKWCCSSVTRQKNPVFMDRATFESAVLMARNANVGIELTGGGEPTLHPDFKDYIRFILDHMGINDIPTLGFVTNGTNIDAVRWFVENTTDPPCWIRVSLNSRDSPELFGLCKEYPGRIGISLVYEGTTEMRKCSKNKMKYLPYAKAVRFRRAMKFIPHKTMTPDKCQGRKFVKHYEANGDIAWCCNSRGNNGLPPKFCPESCVWSQVDLNKIWKYNPFS